MGASPLPHPRPIQERRRGARGPIRGIPRNSVQSLQVDRYKDENKRHDELSAELSNERRTMAAKTDAHEAEARSELEKAKKRRREEEEEAGHKIAEDAKRRRKAAEDLHQERKSVLRKQRQSTVEKLDPSLSSGSECGEIYS